MNTRQTSARELVERHGHEMETQVIGTEAWAMLQRIMELGAYVGEPGSQQLSPNLAPVVDAMFHVLAGGEVCVTIDVPGHDAIRRELHSRLAAARDQANRVNRDAGTDVLAAS